MPINCVAAPACSAPTDRLALGIDSVRSGAAGIGGTLNPSTTLCVPCGCFESSED